MDLRIIDFPEYPWKTLNVHKDFSYSFNISPGKKIEGDLFDSSKMKVVSYNKKQPCTAIGCMQPLRTASLCTQGYGRLVMVLMDRNKGGALLARD